MALHTLSATLSHTATGAALGRFAPPAPMRLAGAAAAPLAPQRPPRSPLAARTATHRPQLHRKHHAMAQYFELHPDNPQPRLLKQAVLLLQKGGILAIPTDSSYALVCQLDDRNAVDQLRRLRGVSDKHHLTLLCRDLSELANYALVDNRQFRLMKLATPGPYTFILDATKEVPRRVSHPSRKTVGLRVPALKSTQMLLELMGAPLLATTLILPGQDTPLNEPQDIREQLEHQLAAVIDAGSCPLEPTTVLDLTTMANGGEPTVMRQGLGALAPLGL